MLLRDHILTGIDQSLNIDERPRRGFLVLGTHELNIDK